VDLICAQGGEGGGHTGDVPTTVLIPAVVDLVRGRTSPMTGQPVQVVAAGGIHDGRLMAAALMMGASAVWVGTRFVLTNEAGAPRAHKDAVRTADFDDNVRTLVFTGRPLRVRRNPYVDHWEAERQDEIRELTSKGIIPAEHDMERLVAGETIPGVPPRSDDDEDDDDTLLKLRPWLMCECAAVVNEQKSAKEVIDEFVNDAVAQIERGQRMCSKL